MNQLQLPISILHATVRNFRVSIPWASLDRNPVRVEIDGIYLLVGPVKKEDWAAGEVRDRRLNIKRGKVETAEKEADARAARQKKRSKGDTSTIDADDHEDEISAKDKGYVARLVQRIVDNLEVTLRNVHLRYEDASLAAEHSGESSVNNVTNVTTGSLPEVVAAVGVTLDEFVICTTDAEFRRGFVDRTRRDASSLVHKVS